MQNQPPFVTVAMPCLNELPFIEACLRSAQSQTYPPDRIEILIADGGSSDGTREILVRFGAEDPRIRTIDNPDRIQATGLNRILEQARGDVIVRMDIHCEYAPDYVEKCVEVLGRTGADNVGGAQRCRGRTPFEKAVCAALTSPLGVGGAAYRSPENEGYVDTVFLGAYRKDTIEKLGGWDAKAVTNEDAELNQRLIGAGGKIFLSRELVVHYTPRGTLAALARQYYRYGRGRARTLVKHRGFLSIRPALPFLTLASGLALVVALPWTNAAFFALALAAFGVVVEALRVGSSGGAARVATICAIFPTLVLSHGAGFATGLIRYLLRPDWQGAVGSTRRALTLALLALAPTDCGPETLGPKAPAGLEFVRISGEVTGLAAAMRQWRTDVEAVHPPSSHRWWSWGLTAVDFDKDGDVDLLATQHGVGNTIVLRNLLVEQKRLFFENANASLGLPAAGGLSGTFRPAVFDIDGDGFPDLCFSAAEPRTCFLNREGRGYESIAFAFAQPDKIDRIEDLDGDGYLDVANWTHRFLFVPKARTFRRVEQPDDVFARMPATTQAELKAACAQPGNRFFRYWCSDRADLDGDRRPDAVCGGFGGYGGSAMGRYLIAGTDGTLVEKGAALGLPREGAPVLVADLNDDGVDDVLVAGAPEGGAFLSSSGRFEAADSALSRFLRQRGSYLQRIVAEDLDQDGDLDLVASLPREKQVVVFENLGKGAFREVATAEGWDAEPIAVADVDGDGLLDVCVGGPGETITILTNRTKAPGRSLQIDLRMPSPNPFAVGALVEVWRPGERDQPQTRPLVRMRARPDGLPLHVGLGTLGTVDLRVRFPPLAKSPSRTVDRTVTAGERRVTLTVP